MPELGWGLQGGMSNCGQVVGPRALDAENCQAWEARQLKYREQLRRLFMRHWQLTPHVSFENYATPAYRDVFSVLSNRDRAAFAKLEPTVGGPPMAEAANLQFSYFEIFVRWSDFPPANVLNLSQIYLALDYCEPNHACATTSPGRKDGQPSTFRRLTLERPKLSSASPCGHPLEQADPFGKKFQAWYFPNNEARAADTFALENFIAAYQRDPEGLSPIPVWKHYFSKPVNETEVVCGPELRYVAGGKTHSVQEIVDPNHLEIRHLANGSHLLKSGPTMGTYRALGNGQCGVCETATVTIYHLSPASGVTVALRAGLNTDMPSNNNDGDIVVAPDWQTVTVYDAQAFTADEGKVTWTSRLYCLSGVKYEACGDGPATPPPIPRQIQWKTETQTSYHEGLHGDSTRHSSIAG